MYPPVGRVRVAAPRRLDETQVRLAVIQRLAWIKQQQKQLQDAARQSSREMVSGESHYVWGSRLRLRVVERPGRAHVEVDGDRLVLYVPEGSDRETLSGCCSGGNGKNFGVPFQHSSTDGSPLSGPRVALGYQADENQVGLLQPRDGQYLDKSRVGQKASPMLGVFVVHEMTHLLERNHGERFAKLMDRFMSDWRSRRDSLTVRHWQMSSGPKG